MLYNAHTLFMLKLMKSMKQKGTIRVNIIDPEALLPSAYIYMKSSSDLAYGGTCIPIIRYPSSRVSPSFGDTNS